MGVTQSRNITGLAHVNRYDYVLKVKVQRSRGVGEGDAAHYMSAMFGPDLRARLNADGQGVVTVRCPPQKAGKDAPRTITVTCRVKGARANADVGDVANRLLSSTRKQAIWGKDGRSIVDVVQPEEWSVTVKDRRKVLTTVQNA
jgi:hypothetical protein